MKLFSDYPLPASRHIPGINARPDIEPLERVASLASNPTTSSTAEHNVAWRYGLRIFNERYYWEAHEVLETVWMHASPNSRERHLVQGVIHITNAALKLVMQRENASSRLSVLALESLRRAYPSGCGRLMGIEAVAVNNVAKTSNRCQGKLVIREQYESE